MKEDEPGFERMIGRTAECIIADQVWSKNQSCSPYTSFSKVKHLSLKSFSD